jgi:hypothetical protein
VDDNETAHRTGDRGGGGCFVGVGWCGRTQTTTSSSMAQSMQQHNNEAAGPLLAKHLSLRTGPIDWQPALTLRLTVERFSIPLSHRSFATQPIASHAD